MSKPGSIISFERLWWGGTLVWLAVMWITRQQQTARLLADPRAAPIAPYVLPAVVAIWLAVALVLWFLVARRNSAAGKWLVVAVAVLGVLPMLRAALAILNGDAGHLASSLLTLVYVALDAGAAAMLFRPDALRWFRGEGAGA